MALQYDTLEPGLALSGKPSSAEDLDGLPFRAILNVCDFQPPGYARGLSDEIQLVRRPINDVYPVPLPYLTLATLELAHLQRMGVPTLVHCHAGRSRSPTVVALFLMARDQMTWDQAIDWIRARRDNVEPNVFFGTDRRRPFVVNAVRSLLSGDGTVLESARLDRDKLIETLRDRPRDPAETTDGWNLIEPGFAIGTDLHSQHTLAALSFHQAVAVDESLTTPWFQMARTQKASQTPQLRHTGEISKLRSIADDIARKRSAGQKVYLVSTGDERIGMFVACAYLMIERSWDVATALWYIGSRRSTIWQHVDVLWSFDWQILREKSTQTDGSLPTQR